jgi:hypothetical protein
MEYESAATEAAGLLDRYLVSLDDQKLDETWASGLFTADAVVEFPMSRHQGLPGMADWHRTALSAVAATQHLGGPVLVDRPSDESGGGHGGGHGDPELLLLRANLVSTHVHHPGTEGEPLFTTGTFVNGEARRTAGGWRLAALRFRLVWLSGTPPLPSGGER